MKSILAMLAMLLFTAQVFAQGEVSGTAALKGGSGSFNGNTGSSTVLFTDSDSSGTFSIVNSGANPYRAAVSASGHVWGAVTGTLTSNCPGKNGYGIGVNGYVLFRRASGALLGSVSTGPISQPFSIQIAGDLPAAGDSYEVVVGNSAFGSATTCTTSVSNVVVTVLQPQTV